MVSIDDHFFRFQRCRMSFTPATPRPWLYQGSNYFQISEALAVSLFLICISCSFWCWFKIQAHFSTGLYILIGVLNSFLCSFQNIHHYTSIILWTLLYNNTVHTVTYLYPDSFLFFLPSLPPQGFNACPCLWRSKVSDANSAWRGGPRSVIPSVCLHLCKGCF